MYPSSSNALSSTQMRIISNFQGNFIVKTNSWLFWDREMYCAVTNRLSFIFTVTLQSGDGRPLSLSFPLSATGSPVLLPLVHGLDPLSVNVTCRVPSTDTRGHRSPYRDSPPTTVFLQLVMSCFRLMSWPGKQLTLTEIRNALLSL